MTEEQQPTGRDLRFCPYCFQMSFDVSEVRAEWVFCEICGVDIKVAELVTQ